MIFDTDILIWFLRGNTEAASIIKDTPKRSISAVTLMELHQGARDKREQRTIGKFFRDQSFKLLPLTENISHRACIYVEEYCLKANMQMADAHIAATAVEEREVLFTANSKHYKSITELELKVFRVS
ncbi:MAG: type II toxin-antitoxin system VapC family toxin [Opitutales bacterium]|nr:type II toxin-antitoxin system VapC family toxin [Opitutales bacterium]